MGKALYRKYRPKSLAEIVGQEHITTTLGNALKKGAVSHAYLFTGPRGTGKTSIARILAHEVNGLPYEEDQTHLDIIEIDAASNRRIDEIRDLRERVHTAPSSAKYKVYIIDEVHMLTKEAFNALLKTLEEPPEHVIFILATTEVHKLPDTIISRTQRFSFKPVDQTKVIEHLRSIAESEKLDVNDEALELIANHGGGSFRDSISLLDQTRMSDGPVRAEEVGRILGIPPQQAIDALWQAIQQHAPEEVIGFLESLRSQGYQSGQLAKRLGARFREELLSGGADPTVFIPALKSLLDIPSSHDADTALELVLLNLVLDGHQVEAIAAPRPVAPRPQVVPHKVESSKPAALPEKESTVEPQSEVQSPPVTASPSPIELTPETWQQILAAIKEQYNTLYSVMRMAHMQVEGSTLLLTFNFGFHQKRINEPKNKQIIIDIVKQKTGQDFSLQAVVGQADALKPVPAAPAVSPPAAQTVAAPAKTSPTLDAVTSVFGGGEILDS